MPNKASGERRAPTGRVRGGRKDRWPGRQEKKKREGAVSIDLPYNIIMSTRIIVAGDWGSENLYV